MFAVVDVRSGHKGSGVVVVVPGSAGMTCETWGVKEVEEWKSIDNREINECVSLVWDLIVVCVWKVTVFWPLTRAKGNEIAMNVLNAWLWLGSVWLNFAFPSEEI